MRKSIVLLALAGALLLGGCVVHPGHLRGGSGQQHWNGWNNDGWGNHWNGDGGHRRHDRHRHHW